MATLAHLSETHLAEYWDKSTIIRRHAGDAILPLQQTLYLGIDACPGVGAQLAQTFAIKDGTSELPGVPFVDTVFSK